MKAFSIIELLIVVICISIFACIAVTRVQMPLINKYRAQTTVSKLATDLRLARSMAINSAATNNRGYGVRMVGTAPYRSYEIIDIKTDSVISSHSIDANVSCTGGQNFQFGPMGNLHGCSDTQLTVTANAKSSVINIVPATGAVSINAN